MDSTSLIFREPSELGFSIVINIKSETLIHRPLHLMHAKYAKQTVVHLEH